MRILLVLFMFCGFLAPGAAVDEQPVITSTLQWAGGPLDAAQAQSWLSDSGNQTIITGDLSDRSQLTETVEFPFVVGSYWQAIVATMEHHHLDLGDNNNGMQFNGTFNGPGLQLVFLGCGELTLNKSANQQQSLNSIRQRYIPAGPALIEIVAAAVTDHVQQQQTRAEVNYRVHLEPRYTFDQIGFAYMQWEPLGQGDLRLPWQSTGRREIDRLRLQQLRGFSRQGSLLNVIGARGDYLPLNRLDLSAHLKLSLIEERRGSATVDLNRKSPVTFAASTTPWQVSIEPPSTHRADLNQVIVTPPSDSRHQGRIAIKLLNAEGKELPNKGLSTRWNSNQGMRYITYVQTSEALPLTVEVTINAITHEGDYPLATQLKLYDAAE